MASNIDESKIVWDAPAQINSEQVQWDNPSSSGILPAIGKTLFNVPSDVYGMASGAAKLGAGSAQLLAQAGNSALGRESFQAPEGRDFREYPTSLVKTGVGLAQLGRNSLLGVPTTPNQSPDYSKYGQAFVDALKENYGSVDAFTEYAKKHPVQAMADVATLFTGGGGILKATSLPGIAKAGEIAGKVGAAIEPINVAQQVTNPIRAALAPAVTGTTGFLNGLGKPVMDSALKGTKEFSEGRIAANAEALQQRIIAAAQQQQAAKVMDWKQKMVGLEKTLKEEKGSFIDLNPLVEKAKEFEQDLNSIPGTKIYDEVALKNTQKIIDTIKNWPSNVGANSVEKLDALRQTIAQNMPGHTYGNKIAVNLKNELVDLIDSQIPGYRKMVADYGHESKWINEIEKDMSSNNMAAMEGKIRTVAKGEKETYIKLMERIAETDPTFAEQYAGWATKKILPQGTFGRMTGLGTFVGVPSAAVGLAGTSVLPGLLAAAIPAAAVMSPHVGSNILHAYGSARNKIGAAMNQIPAGARLGMMQAGRFSVPPSGIPQEMYTR